MVKFTGEKSKPAFRQRVTIMMELVPGLLVVNIVMELVTVLGVVNLGDSVGTMVAFSKSGSS